MGMSFVLAFTRSWNATTVYILYCVSPTYMPFSVQTTIVLAGAWAWAYLLARHRIAYDLHVHLVPPGHCHGLGRALPAAAWCGIRNSSGCKWCLGLLQAISCRFLNRLG